MSGINGDSIIDKLRGELSRLLDYVEKTKSGIEDIETTVMVGSEAMPQASVQINAVTGDLENAANNIMTILEELLEEQDKKNALLSSLSEWAAGLEAGDREKGEAIISEISALNDRSKKDLMEIFSNMSFHDLSGQKLRKVATSLSVVQSKLFDIANTFGIKNFEASSGSSNEAVKNPMDQNIVDALLKELGT